VEIIFASNKREDADRKLCNRWLQDMTTFRNMGGLGLGTEPRGSGGSGGDLSGRVGGLGLDKEVIFVLLSSDQDYRHMAQSAVNNGYKVVWIHEAGKNTKWRQV